VRDFSLVDLSIALLEKLLQLGDAVMRSLASVRIVVWAIPQSSRPL